MRDRNMAERLRKGLENARRSYERPGDSYFWPEVPDAQAKMVHWLSGIVHEPRWPIEGRKAAFGLLQRLAGEVEALHPTARDALQAVAVEALAAGPPKLTGRPSTAWKDRVIVDMFRSLRRQGYRRPQAVGWLAQAAELSKGQVRDVLRAARVG